MLRFCPSLALHWKQGFPDHCPPASDLTDRVHSLSIYQAASDNMVSCGLPPRSGQNLPFGSGALSSVRSELSDGLVDTPQIDASHDLLALGHPSAWATRKTTLTRASTYARLWKARRPEGPKAQGSCDEPWALHNTSDATRNLPPQTSVSTGRVRFGAVADV